MLESLSSFGKCEVSPTYPVFESDSSFYGCGVSPTCPRTDLCLVFHWVWSLAYTRRAETCHVVLVGGEVLLPVQCWNLSDRSSGEESVGEESLTRPALEYVFLFFIWGVCLTRAVLESV